MGPETTCIYGLIDPRDGRIRYVGKADDPKKRLRAHIKDRGVNHKTNWIKSVRAAGLRPEVVILQTVPVDTWQLWERAWIASTRNNGCDLVNGTDGGDGGHGVVVTQETRQKISLSLLGNSRSKGHSPTAEVRHAVSEKLSGRKRSPRSPEWLENMSKAQTGKNLSDEHRRKLSEAGKGHTVSEETRRKLVEAWARRKARESGNGS